MTTMAKFHPVRVDVHLHVQTIDNVHNLPDAAWSIASTLVERHLPDWHVVAVSHEGDCASTHGHVVVTARSHAEHSEALDALARQITRIDSSVITNVTWTVRRAGVPE